MGKGKRPLGIDIADLNSQTETLNLAADDLNFRLLFESAPALLLVLNLDLTIAAVSDGYLHATMTKREDILGRQLFDIFPANHEDLDSNGYENFMTSWDTVLRQRAPHTMAVQKYDIRKPAAQGGAFEERYWSVVNTPVLDAEGQIKHVIHRVEDVTEFVRLKQEAQEQSRFSTEAQKRAALQLETEVYLRAQEIQQHSATLETLNESLTTARDQAIEASQLKSAFVANISHELRTPLAGLVGFLELALSMPLDSEQQELISTANDSAEALLDIVNDILDLSRIEAGKAKLEHVPFNGIFLVQDVCRLLAESAKKKGIALSTYVDHRIPHFIVGDPARIRQVLLNLVANAIKFTDTGEVAVRAAVQHIDSQRVKILFSVTDTGIGISDEDRHFLFSPFSQVDSSNTRRYGGTGLGLAISKSLVEMMRGHMDVESQKGQGSTFWFEVAFPLHTPTKLALRLADKDVIAGNNGLPEGKLVLVVEDSPVIQMLVAKQLINLGVQCQAVSNGKLALEALSALSFDLILMDCQMPEMDGFVATKAIRQFETKNGRHTPIIAMTAGAMSGDKEKCLAAGMDDYLSKPFSLLQLQKKAEQWMPLTERPVLTKQVSNKVRQYRR